MPNHPPWLSHQSSLGWHGTCQLQKTPGQIQWDLGTTGRRVEAEEIDNWKGSLNRRNTKMCFQCLELANESMKHPKSKVIKYQAWYKIAKSTPPESQKEKKQQKFGGFVRPAWAATSESEASFDLVGHPMKQHLSRQFPQVKWHYSREFLNDYLSTRWDDHPGQGESKGLSDFINQYTGVAPQLHSGILAAKLKVQNLLQPGGVYEDSWSQWGSIESNTNLVLLTTVLSEASYWSQSATSKLKISCISSLKKTPPKHSHPCVPVHSVTQTKGLGD